MIKKMLIAFVLVQAGYVLGDGPWCTVTNYGSMACFYWSYQSCVSMCRSQGYGCVTCAPNPQQN